MLPSRLSRLDRWLVAADEALRALTGAVVPGRPVPPAAEGKGSNPRLSAGLMRVNHTGEVCAQALYSGQAVFARDEGVHGALMTAAAEERDHLAWCRSRLRELGSRPSLLDPLWYVGSFGMGLVSGAAGDRLSMSFLAETEDQVERHLDGHLDRLPADDARSRAVVAQMRDDERRHGALGRSLGGEELPYPVRLAMKGAARVMTRTAFWV